MADQLGEISAADAAMLYDIISSPPRGPKVHDERQRLADAHANGPPVLLMSLLSPMTKSASACCNGGGKKRLLKDRIRKQQSKEKFQTEIDELKQTAATLHETLSVAQAERKRKTSTVSEWKSNALVERGRVQEAIATRTSLFNQVVEQVEKAVLFKSLSWRRFEGDMIIDPKRDPWQLHTLSNAYRDQHVLALAEFQREKVTPDLFSRFASSSSAGMFNLVLDDTNQHIAFLEQRKYGVIEGHYADIARTIYDAFSTTTGEGREANFYGKDLVLATFPWGGIRRRICMQLVHDGDRVFLMHRSILYDETLQHKIAEHVATWWCFEPMPDAPGTCLLRGYSQVALDTPPSSASHEYAVFMKRSTENEVRVNHLLSSRFKCLDLN
ncbi:hypothetical protein SPRG_05342 [Saprolegnia parasitica CBS 223.65]|uniref:START domain-containing protein n=1 Tax=Saprolegnia parasitica (strain CBS 223.65) TaxID=695850 RepID=A0A067CLS1_SAPPC|nr:hypothetical protein SPRG_05342 [Saprolegnia parasitica CBS 223.65]KDO30150.1 hypothetical protein SPRG_05342 [Saprolegnia parasitica CBS 223.65]|eukprot:XP_012199328.1 hypothetical protein SPRG_05342 [Saprolegnia parasitica CBS 223.65]